MDPQLKAVLVGVISMGTGAISTWFVQKGIIPADQQSQIATDLTSLALGGGAAIIGALGIWWHTYQNSRKKLAETVVSTPEGQAAVVKEIPQTTLIRAVNQADNGVKVVAASEPGPQINMALK